MMDRFIQITMATAYVVCAHLFGIIYRGIACLYVLLCV